MLSEQEVAVSPLKLLRITRGLSQDEVVKRVRDAGGYTDRGELSRFERGLQVLTPAKRELLAAALGVEADELQVSPSPTEAPQEANRG